MEEQNQKIIGLKKIICCVRNQYIKRMISAVNNKATLTSNVLKILISKLRAKIWTMKFIE